MLELWISPKAENDLDDIWLYSLQNWGKFQAKSYILTLDHTMELLCANPMLGTAMDNVKPGYRRMPVTSHTIIYRPTNEKLEIIRVLHKSVDVERWF